MVRGGLMMASSALLSAFLLSPDCGVLAGEVLAAGRGFTLMVDQEMGIALAVGRNTYGQLGINSTANAPEVAEMVLPEGEKFVFAAAGAFHSLFLAASGKVYSAGRNNHGQLGHSGSGLIPEQVMLPEGVHAMHIAAGYAHSLILTHGELYAFGMNTQGQLGDGTTESRSEPRAVELPPSDEDACTNSTKIRAMAAGYDFSYFVLADTAYGASCDGIAYSMGQGLGGQLGTGRRESEKTPTRVAIDSVSMVAAGDTHAVLLLKSGAAAATGSNFDGQLGFGSTDTFAATPMELPLSSEDAELLSTNAGGDSSCLVLGSGEAKGFGSNRAGQLGLGSMATAAAPTTIGASSVTEVSLGESHSLLLTIGLAVYATGSNAYGQLGDGSTNSTRTPLKVEELALATSTATITETTTVAATETVTEGPIDTTGTTTSGGPMEPTSTVTGTSTLTRAAQDTGRSEVMMATIWVGSVAVAGVIFLLVATYQGSGTGGDDEVELA